MDAFTVALADAMKAQEPVVSAEEADLRLRAALTERGEAMRARGLVNPIEFARALGVKPQQVYNYIRSGRIVARFNDTQKYVIEWPEAVKYAARYYTMQQKKTNRIKEELEG